MMTSDINSPQGIRQDLILRDVEHNLKAFALNPRDTMNRVPRIEDKPDVVTDLTAGQTMPKP